MKLVLKEVFSTDHPMRAAIWLATFAGLGYPWLALTVNHLCLALLAIGLAVASVLLTAGTMECHEGKSRSLAWSIAAYVGFMLGAIFFLRTHAMSVAALIVAGELLLYSFCFCDFKYSWPPKKMGAAPN